MQHAEQRGMLMVAASGNDRRKLNFPALDVRVAAVGGLEPDKTIWNDRLDLPTAMLRGECPDRVAAYLERQGDECGSNFTGTIPGERRQEVVFAARNIYSTIYTGQNWNPYLQCGDSYGDTDAGNGRGECSGTSMSAPLYSGLAGILRSINPLVMPGNPESTVDALGIRDAIVENAAVPGGLTTWDPKYGYGIPNAEGAVQTMLGAVAGRTIKNRLTPLFNLYGATATDWAQVTVPQAAIALLINEEGAYASQGATVSAYPAFPGGTSMAPPLPAPKAAMYVLTTEYQPNASTPPLLPLYWLDRARPTPLGCLSGPACNLNNRDFLLMTSTSHVQTAYADGYTFRGLQGYVYAPCTPEATCIPAGAERLYRKCNVTEDDCALFLERDRATFEAQGYTAVYPAGSASRIGYAYPNVDSDGDGLIDGFERLLNTRVDLADSDGDGVSDGVEFPLAGIRVTDPCNGPVNQCISNVLFANGFEF